MAVVDRDWAFHSGRRLHPDWASDGRSVLSNGWRWNPASPFVYSLRIASHEQPFASCHRHRSIERPRREKEAFLPYRNDEHRCEIDSPCFLWIHPWYFAIICAFEVRVMHADCQHWPGRITGSIRRENRMLSTAAASVEWFFSQRWNEKIYARSKRSVLPFYTRRANEQINRWASTKHKDKRWGRGWINARITKQDRSIDRVEEFMHIRYAWIMHEGIRNGRRNHRVACTRNILIVNFRRRVDLCYRSNQC